MSEIIHEIPPTLNPKAIITLEVGHGPYPEDQCEKEGEARFDYGAIDPRTGAREWDLNTIAARSCHNKLLEYGYDDVLILDPCDFLTAIGRKNRKSDVFVSIHHNAFHNPDAQGAEALCHKVYASPNDEKLAALCSDYMAKELNIMDRGVKYRGLGVLAGVTQNRWRDSTAAVLTEGYFITGRNVTDHEQWSEESGEAIAKAIHGYCQLTTFG